MHIAIVLDSLRIGGAEMLAFSLAKGFLKAGHKLSIIALGVDGPLAPLLAKAGIACFILNSPTGIRFTAMWQLLKILKNEKFDLVVSNHFRQLFHTWLPATLANIPHYHIEHDNNLYKTKTKYVYLLNFFLLNLTQLILISPTLGQWFHEQLPKKKDRISVVSNGIDTSAFKPSLERKRQFRQEHCLTEDCIIFGTCSRLESVKNISSMLRIFQHQQARKPNSFLVIVGDGSCRKQLEVEAQQLGITGHVLFQGQEENVIPWLQAMDIFLLTSYDEGLPLSILEAMSCGIPVVTRPVGDLSRLINEAHGRLIIKDDMNAWLDAFDQVTCNVETYSLLSANARQLVANDYSLTRCVSKYLQLFQRSCRS